MVPSVGRRRRTADPIAESHKSGVTRRPNHVVCARKGRGKFVFLASPVCPTTFCVFESRHPSHGLATNSSTTSKHSLVRPTRACATGLLQTSIHGAERRILLRNHGVRFVADAGSHQPLPSVLFLQITMLSRRWFMGRRLNVSRRRRPSPCLTFFFPFYVYLSFLLTSLSHNRSPAGTSPMTPYNVSVLYPLPSLSVFITSSPRCSSVLRNIFLQPAFYLQE